MMRNNLPAIVTAAALLLGSGGCATETSLQPELDEEEVRHVAQELDATCYYFSGIEWVEFSCVIPGTDEPAEHESGDGGGEEFVPTPDYGIEFSSAGSIAGKHCTQIIEPADLSGGWGNNYLRPGMALPTILRATRSPYLAR